MLQFGTIIGFLFGLSVIVWTILERSPHPSIFLDLPSLAIVGGGLLASIMMTYRTSGIILLFKGLWESIFQLSYRPQSIAERSLEYVKIVRERGVSALESETSNIDDVIEKEFLELTAAGYQKEDVINIIDDKIYYKLEQYDEKERIFDSLARFAPGFGMFGTVIGVVIMLDSMAKDPAQIGPALSVALITTFYGILASYLLFAPLSEKMGRTRLQAESYYSVLREGIRLTFEKRNDIYAKDALNAFLLEKHQLK